MLNFVFLMDPLETVNPKKDTSFALMQGAIRQGHAVFHLSPGNITLTNGRLSFEVTQVEPNTTLNPPFSLLGTTLLQDHEVHAVFIRTDPPFNERYLMDTWLLDRLPEKVVVMNRPSGVRTVNEKIWVTQFTQFTPPTLISRRKEAILQFLAHHDRAIAKPTNGYGGSAVFKLTAGDSNRNVILETLSQGYTREIIVQPYIPESELGDKRILVFNGQPLGAVLRVHSKEDHRNNFFAGGSAQPTEITTYEHTVIETLKPHLLQLGLHFVGIDIIGTYLIEINVTSPTCLLEMNHFLGTHLENQIIKTIETTCFK